MGYWEDRFTRVAEETFKIADRTEKGIMRVFRKGMNEVNDKVSAFYGKYGITMESPVFDADGIITGYTYKNVVPKDVANFKLAKGTRLTKLEGQITEIVKDFTKESTALTGNALKEVAEYVYYENIYEIYKGVGMGTSFNLLPKSTINSLIKNPVNGSDFVQRSNINNKALAQKVNQTLRGGITQGLGIKDMTKHLNATVNVGYNNAKRIIQTETNNTMSQAAIESYTGSGVVSQYIFIATLDNRTSDICTELDGEIFDLDKAVTGINMPPLHPNCRSTTGAYLDVKGTFTRMARDNSGKNFTVPDSMTAKDFKKIYVENSMTRSEWDKTR